MFSSRKLLQAVGVSLLITIVISFIVGFFPIPSFSGYVFFQMLITYGSLGYFSAKWNSKTPYTAAFLGGTIVSILSLFTAYFMFNVIILWDPEGVSRSISLAILFTMLVTVVTVFIQQIQLKKAGSLS